MTSEDVASVLDALERAGVAVWIDGGWGVDALVGRQTRPHSDLDLAIDRRDLPSMKRIFEELGFRHDADVEPGLPARFVVKDDLERQVDVHPLRFDDDGNGWQQLSDTEDEWGLYPAAGLRARGSIGGRAVDCLSADLQVRFHQGYDLGPNDEHDLALLHELTG